VNSLHTYLPQDRLRAIANNTSLPDRISGSVLFADISGFTALTDSLHASLGSRKGAEELSKRLDAAFAALVTEVEGCGGSVIGFAGDAITCWFDGEGSEVRAVCTGLGMQTSFVAFPDLFLKVSIASGDARRFIVGDKTIQRIDVLAGETVSRSARGERMAGKGEVLVDEATTQLLADGVKVSERREEYGDKFAVIKEFNTQEKAQPQKIPVIDPVLLKEWVLPQLQQREAFPSEFRPGAALFIRFIGIDYETDEAQGQLDKLVQEMQKTAVRYDGTLLQVTIGDKGSYAYINFGALISHEENARSAMKAALELRNKIELQLQMGITQGLMLVGAYGGETRKTFGALGNDVNLAARLMTSAAEGEILLSIPVRKAVTKDFICEPHPPVPVKGIAELLTVFALTGERLQRAIRLQEPTYALPMVGRTNELQIINDKLDLAEQGKGQVIGITAEAGMGKSRLVAEVIRLACKKGFTGYGGACQSDAVNTPYQTWKSVWGAFFDVDPSAPLKKQMRSIEGEIEDHAPNRMGAMPLLNVVLDLEIPDNDFTKSLEPQYRKSALRALLEDCLRTASKDEPLLIVIEDMHWIDALSHDLLEELARAMAGNRVCFLLAYRPPQLQRLQAPRIEAMPNFTKIDLPELNQTEAESAIRAKLLQLYPARGGALPESLVDALMRRAQGNPFYLEELLNYVRDRGLDPSDIQNIELPDSLHTLILSRIDQLSEQEKTTLRVASIVGRLFRAQWLTGYYPELGSFLQVKAALDALDSLDITPLDSPEPELAYLFKHIVTHEVTYESLPFATRAKLHEQLARYLESIVGATRESPIKETHTINFISSEKKEKKIAYMRPAAEAALNVSARINEN
jgi:class 3 adenylate cyclase